MSSAMTRDFPLPVGNTIAGLSSRSPSAALTAAMDSVWYGRGVSMILRGVLLFLFRMPYGFYTKSYVFLLSFFYFSYDKPFDILLSFFYFFDHKSFVFLLASLYLPPSIFYFWQLFFPFSLRR
jgi:hypothetical protein